MIWEDLKLSSSTIDILKKTLKFDLPTPIQAKCVPEIINRRDVIAEAPTGSGKTLAYLLPIVELLGKSEHTKHQVGALILVPNRELAVQIFDVLQYFLELHHLSCATFVGGGNISKDASKFQKDGANILIATPGRLEELFNAKSLFEQDFSFLKCFKSLEIVILDEADRLFEHTFQRSLTSILENLPKQRRVSLFSATQSTYEDELKKVGLRNPVKVTLKDDQSVIPSRVPSTLKNYYAVVEPFSKFSALCQFVKAHKKSKILIFLSNCACVDYLGRLLTSLLLPKKKYAKKSRNKLQILTIHGKKRARRCSIFKHFRQAADSCVLVCTDVMARGLDMPDVDWVVQFDVPRTVNFFLHRCGRTARSGQAGNAVLFLLPSETDYVSFLNRNQQVLLEKLDLPPDTDSAEKIFEKVRKLAADDRGLLIKGTRAFVSFIQSYSKHDCGIVCQLDDLDVVNIAHAYGLLRLPKMPELKNRDLSGFRRCAINTADVKFKNAASEEKRLEKKKNGRQSTDKIVENDNDDRKGDDSRTPPNHRGNKRSFDSKEFSDLNDDYGLIKKLKKGKISKKQFDDEFLH